MDNMDVDEERKRQGLFAQCSFAIIRSAAFSDKDADSVGGASGPTREYLLTQTDGRRVETPRWRGCHR